MDRFLHLLHHRTIRPSQKDILLMKDSKKANYFFISMYSLLDLSLPLDFPSPSIRNPIVPPKLNFSTWEAFEGKVLTLDQLKKKRVHSCK